jgi:hypothetical protein
VAHCSKQVTTRSKGGGGQGAVRLSAVGVLCCWESKLHPSWQLCSPALACCSSATKPDGRAAILDVRLLSMLRIGATLRQQNS